MERALSTIDLYRAGYDRAKSQAEKWETFSIQKMLKASLERLANACAHQPNQYHLLNHDAGVVDALTDILLDRGLHAIVMPE